MTPPAEAPAGNALTRAWRWLRLHDRYVVAASAVVVLGVVGFAWVAHYVRTSELADLERRAILALRTADDPADPLGPLWFEELVRDLTALGGTAVLLLVGGTGVAYSVLRRDRASAALLAASVVGAMVCSNLLKWAFSRPRPDLVPHGMHVLTESFPSGHSMGAAATYLSVAVVVAAAQPLVRLRVFVLAMAVLVVVLVGASRVYLGVHWPSDVLAGWAAGTAWAATTWVLVRHARLRRAEAQRVTRDDDAHGA